MGQEPHRLRVYPWRLHAAQRVAPEQLVTHGSDKHSVERAVRLGNGAGSQWLAVTSDLRRQSREPCPQHRGRELSQLDVAEHRQDVVRRLAE